MQELHHRVLASSHRTVSAEISEEANKEINTQLRIENICIPQELSSSFQGPSNPPRSMKVPLHTQ